MNEEKKRSIEIVIVQLVSSINEPYDVRLLNQRMNMLRFEQYRQD